MGAGGTKVPSKSLEYMLVNLLKVGADLDGGLSTNTPAEDVCLFLIALADLTLSLASCSRCSGGPPGGGTGVSLALAECDRGRFSRVLGLSMLKRWLSRVSGSR